MVGTGTYVWSSDDFSGVNSSNTSTSVTFAPSASVGTRAIKFQVTAGDYSSERIFVSLSKSVLVPLKVRVALLVPLRLNKPLVFSVMLKVAVVSLATRVWVVLGVPSLIFRVLMERINTTTLRVNFDQPIKSHIGFLELHIRGNNFKIRINGYFTLFFLSNGKCKCHLMIC
jgi:hypothetical protein